MEVLLEIWIMAVAHETRTECMCNKIITTLHEHNKHSEFPISIECV